MRNGFEKQIAGSQIFDNAGIGAYLARLAHHKRGPVLLGANVGINKEGAEPERDYPALIAAVAPRPPSVPSARRPRSRCQTAAASTAWPRRLLISISRKVVG